MRVPDDETRRLHLAKTAMASGAPNNLNHLCERFGVMTTMSWHHFVVLVGPHRTSDKDLE